MISESNDRANGAGTGLYRIQLLDYRGRRGRSDVVEANSDEQAIAKVRAMKLGVNAEIWLLHRKVGEVLGRKD